MARKKIIHVRCTDATVTLEKPIYETTDATITFQTPYTRVPGVFRGWPDQITGHDASTRRIRTTADAEIPKRVVKNLEQLEDWLDDDVINEVVELSRQHRNGARLAHVSRTLQALDRLKTALTKSGGG